MAIGASLTIPDGRIFIRDMAASLGGLDALLRNQGISMIKKCSLGVNSLALQTSHNLLQYFAVDSQIQDYYLHGNDQDHPGNVETLAVGTDLPPSKLG